MSDVKFNNPALGFDTTNLDVDTDDDQNRTPANPSLPLGAPGPLPGGVTVSDASSLGTTDTKAVQARGKATGAVGAAMASGDDGAPYIPPPTGPAAAPGAVSQNLGGQIASIDAGVNMPSLAATLAGASQSASAAPAAGGGGPTEYNSSDGLIGADVGNLEVAALNIEMNSAIKDQNNAKAMQRAADQAKHDEKTQELNDTQDKISGERKAANQKVISAGVSLLASFGTSFAGAGLQQTGKFGGVGVMTGAGLQGMGQGMGQLAEATLNAGDTNNPGGGQYTADQAQLRIIVDQRLQDESQELSDESKNWADNSNDRFKQNLQAFQGIFDRQQQENQAIWRS